MCTSTWIEVSFFLGTSARICKENLQFDRKRFQIWLLNTGHVKTKGVFVGTATRKLTNTPAVIFSYLCWGKWFLFTKQIIIVLFWVIFYSYGQKFLNIVVLLKTFHNSQETPVSEFHFNQPVACCFFNKRLRHRFFLLKFAKLSKTPFFQTTLRLLLMYSLNNLFSFFTSDPVNLLLSVVNSFMTEIPIILKPVQW